MRQQAEHKKLIEDNASLMREVKGLRENLRGEQKRVEELYEDAAKVREELKKELLGLERAKAKLH